MPFVSVGRMIEHGGSLRSGADTDQNPQHFHVRGPLCHGGIEAVAALFYCGEVESGSVRDRLKEIWICCVSIGPGNCRMLPHVQGWDGLRKGETRIKIRVVGAAAISRPPTRIQRQLREVCEP